MIRSFKHRGLKLLYQQGKHSGLNPEYVEKIRRILARLDQAVQPRDMDLPEHRLHPLKGKLAGQWSVTVRANWRIVFRFDGVDVVDVDYH